MSLKDLEFKGLHVNAAKRLAEDNKLIVRTIEKDGNKIPVINDFNPNRVNFVLVNNMVTYFDYG